MAYKDFTFQTLREKFGIKYQIQSLFADIKPIAPSDFLTTQLSRIDTILITSEKAKSEFILAPILIEVRELSNRVFNIFSGDFLEADKKEGLFGECDFILSRNNQSFVLEAPIFTMVEAKRGDISAGIPQCIAQMLGAMRFNQRQQNPIPTGIYGCVTNALDWLFLRLSPDLVVQAHTQYFHFDHLDRILGVFDQIIKTSINTSS